MENLFSKEFLSFVDRHKTVFLMVVFLTAIVYLYVDKNSSDNRYADEIRKLNEKNLELTIKTLEYERERSGRYEFILNNLSKNPPQNVPK